MTLAMKTRLPTPSTSINKEEENQNEDDLYADLGIFFDGSLPSTLKHYEFPIDFTKSTSSVSDKHDPTKSSTSSIQVVLHVVDEDPGATQSGHSVWPAAVSLADYLAKTRLERKDSNKQEPQSILELGAGCALVSLVALQLYSESLQCLIVTDRDPGTLDRARDSYESTLENLYEKADTEDQQLDCINILGSIPVEFEALEWGKRKDQNAQLLEGSMSKIMANRKVIPSNHVTESSSGRRNSMSSIDATSSTSTAASTPMSSPNNTAITFAIPTEMDLILGSDLIYCAEVVKSLFQTAVELMHDQSVFLLAQSFEYDDETENEINQACEKLQLERSFRIDEWKTTSDDSSIKTGVRIQEFKLKSPVQNENN